MAGLMAARATPVPMAARTAVPMAGLMAERATPVPTAVRTAARTAEPVATAVPTAGRTAAPAEGQPEREPDRTGPGGAEASPGPVAVHEPGPGGLRRAVLVAAATADLCRGHRQLLHRPARPHRRRRTAVPAWPAHALPADRQGRRRGGRETVHHVRRGRRGDRRPGVLRRGAAAVRRREHRRPAGPAPAVAPADRVRRSTGC